MDYADPEEFKSFASGQAKQIYDQALGNLGGKALQMSKDGLAPYIVDAQGDVAKIYRRKQVGKALGDSTGYLERAERELSQTFQPAEQQRIEQEIVAHVGKMRSAGAYSPQQSVKIVQDIKERDSFMRAKRDLSMSADPLKDLDGIQKKYPNISPDKVVGELSVTAGQRVTEMRRIQKEAETEVKDEYLRNDYLDALKGKITIDMLPGLATARRYKESEVKSLKSAIEEGGVTDPATFSALQAEILAGRNLDYGSILRNPALDRNAKTTLMNKIDEVRRRKEDTKEEKHFSKTPEYQEAIREYRSAISRKGPMESLSPTEQARLNFGQQQIWDRASKGENPMMVARELQTRMTPEEQAGDAPLFTPRFQDEAQLVQALKSGRITRDQAGAEALLLKQWQEWRLRVAEKARQPAPQGGTSGRRNTR